MPLDAAVANGDTAAISNTAAVGDMAPFSDHTVS